MSARSLEYVPLDALPSALLNPKEHDEALIEQSMHRFGFLEIPVIDERTGRLIAGHGRRDQLLAIHAAGGDPPEGITVTDDGTWLVPTIRGWQSTTDDEAHAAGIAINRGAEAGGWNIPVLYDILDTYSGTEGGLVGLGFDVHELDDMVAQLRTDDLTFDPTVSSDPLGAHAEDSHAERAQRYAQKGIRSLILDYAINDFDELAATCARLRRFRNEETNAALVGTLIREAALELPADYEPDDLADADLLT